VVTFEKRGPRVDRGFLFINKDDGKFNPTTEDMNEDKKVFSRAPVIDYRVIRPSVFLQKGGNTVIQIQQVSTFNIEGCQVSFITPNAVTMFYNKSWKEYENAVKIYDTIIKSNLSGKDEYNVRLQDTSKLYDYFEHIQASVITIYSAIEALCNIAIPKNFTLTKKNSKGVKEIWDKSSIEKWIPTEEKVGKIIPEILNIESPKKLPIWKSFKELKEIRDSIIHQKQSFKNPIEIESSFLKFLLDQSIFRKIMSGFELIRYFCAKDRMHTYFPILDDEVPLHVNIVDDVSGDLASEAFEHFVKATLETKPPTK
jgi:hypothetical protein